MKIEKLIIYGFGKHENVTIEFGPGINVLYGLNEAGKSTIQQFILHILFGFPQRNSTNLRYEPKSGGKYGGQVIFTDNTLGNIIVERIRGKSAGEVTVFFQDGKRGGEEELKTILRQYDRTSFESIFSFSLLQLQGFEKMDEDELSRTLLASGTTGVESLLQLEKKLEKVMGDLFKKTGKNPEMNVKMAELRDLELELKIEQEKVEEYTPSIERINEIDNRLSKLRETGTLVQKSTQDLSLLRQMLPLRQKKETLETRLSQLNTVDFPADGIRRLESLSEKLKETLATKHRIEEEIAEMSVRVPKGIEINPIAEIELLLAKESEWHSWRSATSSAEEEIRKLTSEKRHLLDRLGIKDETTAADLYVANVSLHKEKEMHELLSEVTNCISQIRFAEQRLSSVEIELQEAKKNQNKNKDSAPSKDVLERVQAWPEIRAKLAEAKAYISISQGKVTQHSRVVPVLLFIIALICIIFGVSQKEWGILFAGIILGAAGSFLFPKKSSVTQNSSKLQEFEKYLQKHKGNEVQIEKITAQIQAYTREKERIEEMFLTLEQHRNSITKELYALRINRKELDTVLSNFLKGYGLTELSSPEIVPELFRMIRNVQKIMHDMNEAAQQKSLFRKRIEERTNEVELIVGKTVPTDSIYEMLRKEYMRLSEEIELIKSLNSRMEKLQSPLKETVILANTLQDGLQLLLSEAGAESEEAFYRAYDVHQESLLLKGQLSDTIAQLEANGSLYLTESMTEEELMKRITENETEQSSIREELDILINERASLVNKTDQLLTDETFGQKLQLFEMKKAELTELAKKWSASKAIIEAIRRIMIELKEKKLPEVQFNASAIFNALTDYKYEKLSVNDDGYFEAVTSGGMRHPIVELSQATKEQAYISLRLALAASVMSSAPFPIIMDDPFVHFDGDRLSRMVDIVSELQINHQFIYFTCHDSMKSKWSDAQIINVSNIGSEQGAFVL